MMPVKDDILFELVSDLTSNYRGADLVESYGKYLELKGKKRTKAKPKKRGDTA